MEEQIIKLSNTISEKEENISRNSSDSTVSLTPKRDKGGKQSEDEQKIITSDVQKCNRTVKCPKLLKSEIKIESSLKINKDNYVKYNKTILNCFVNHLYQPKIYQSSSSDNQRIVETTFTSRCRKKIITFSYYKPIG